MTFNAWVHRLCGGQSEGDDRGGTTISPPFLVAFNAWLATDPFTNSHAPPGPTYMPQYVQPGQAQSNALDVQANRYYNLGATAGDNSDNYVRIVVYLATVLFLVGISGHSACAGADRPRRRRRGDPDLLGRELD